MPRRRVSRSARSATRTIAGWNRRTRFAHDLIDGGVLDNKPIEFTKMANDRVTPAVEQMRKDGTNSYNGNRAAVTAGWDLKQNQKV